MTKELKNASNSVTSLGKDPNMESKVTDLTRIINLIKSSSKIKKIIGVKVNVLDKGGQLIRDNDGNVVGKQDPLLEFTHGNTHRLLVSFGIKTVMKEYLLEIEDVKKIWMGFINMDIKNRGFITCQ